MSSCRLRKTDRSNYRDVQLLVLVATTDAEGRSQPLLVEMQLSLVRFELVHDLPYTRTRSSTQALQRDDSLNPGWFTLLDGQDRFQRDCSGCHTLADLRGAAPRYPAFDTASGRSRMLPNSAINTVPPVSCSSPPLIPASARGFTMVDNGSSP